MAASLPNQPGDPYEPLLEHARDVWKAEEENARRLARRVNLNLTVITAAVGALIGFGFPRIVEQPSEPTWVSITVIALIAGGVTCLGIGGAYLLNLFRSLQREGLVFQLGSGKRSRLPPASTRLFLPQSAYAGLTMPTPGTPEFIRYHAFARVSQAASDLAERNTREARRIDEGQLWMVLGLLLILAALLLYFPTRSPIATGLANDQPEPGVIWTQQ